MVMELNESGSAADHHFSLKGWKRKKKENGVAQLTAVMAALLLIVTLHSYTLLIVALNKSYIVIVHNTWWGHERLKSGSLTELVDFLRAPHNDPFHGGRSVSLKDQTTSSTFCSLFHSWTFE